jgi:hypothetical protein
MEVSPLSLAFSFISVEETSSGGPEPYFQDQTRYSNRTAGRKGEKMKTSTIGIFSAGILMVVAGVGFGIAHAVGTKTDRPVLSLEGLWRSPKSSGKIAGR